MIRRSLIAIASVAVLVAVVMVVTAANSPDGFASALGIWGFVLAIVSVVVGIGGLWPQRSKDDPASDTQINYSEQGDVYGVLNGDQYVKCRGDNSSKIGKYL